MFYREILDLFTRSEIINWQDLCSRFETILRTGGEVDSAAVFSKDTKAGEQRWKDFKIRVVESVSIAINPLDIDGVTWE